MFKYLFAFLVFVHAVLHSLGFYRSFGWGSESIMRMNISREMGLLWLITAVLFLITGFAYLSKKSWAFVTLPAVVLSQVLIIASWEQTKWASILNCIILIVVVPAIGKNWFLNESKRAVSNLQAQPITSNPVVTEAMISAVPPVVQNWLRTAGVVGRNKIRYVHIEQSGTMRIKPGGRWMPFSARQCFTTEHPGFVWMAEVSMLPGVSLMARDSSIRGEAEMVIKLFSILPVVNEVAGDKINSSAMVRYLAETCWFPTAALNKYISWEQIDNTCAKATMLYEGIKVTGVFRFSENGDLLSFEADRYKDNTEGAALVPWLIQVKRYGRFDGLRVPDRCSVTWKLPGGNFTWVDIMVRKIQYDGDLVPLTAKASASDATVG